MPPRKNDETEIVITGITGAGMGVGHIDGFAVFVPGCAPNERVRAKIIKVASRYAIGKLMNVILPSADRIPSDCPVSGSCGGCCYRHMTYEAELRAKEQQVIDAFRRIGGYDGPVLPILPSPTWIGYRNKAQIPIRAGADGIQAGFYARGSHRIVPHERCLLGPPIFDALKDACVELLVRFGVPPYNEETGGGTLRHLYFRIAETTGEIMVCFVLNDNELPHAGQICRALTTRFPEITSIALNINRQDTNVILGSRCVTLWGRDTIVDRIAGIECELSPQSFYQVNRSAAELVYKEAEIFAGLTGAETVYDLYCGIGVIGLSMAGCAAQVVGVEISEAATENARKNAARNGIENASFFTADVADFERAPIKAPPPDVVLLDPPRKGCTPAVLASVARLAPERVVMISCNPATAARDCALLTGHGYAIQSLRPVDLFPRTGNVECVTLLTKTADATDAADEADG